jgi:serine/threonine-protein phosphatase 2B catalytic subunit
MKLEDALIYSGNSLIRLKAADAFLKKNKLLSILRGHESQLDGYKMHRWKGLKEFPTVITIFSAANYCDSYNNKGGVVKFENNSLNIQQYSSAPHPYCLPDFMNAIGWSIPFLCEKITEMLMHILNVQSSDTDSKAPIIASEENVMKIKIQFLAKMMKMYKTLREENELILKLKGLCNTHKLPRGLLLEGKNAIIDAIEEYGKAKTMDKNSEKRPTFVMPPQKP